MKIIRTNIDNLEASKTMLYKLTRSKGEKMSKADGTFPVDAFLLYEDVNSKGEEQRVLSIISGGRKLDTISTTFIREFEAIADIMDGDPFSIVIIHSTSKAGREFVTCELDCGF